MFLNLLFYYELSELWGGATSICDGNFFDGPIFPILLMVTSDEISIKHSLITVNDTLWCIFFHVYYQNLGLQNRLCAFSVEGEHVSVWRQQWSLIVYCFALILIEVATTINPTSFSSMMPYCYRTNILQLSPDRRWTMTQCHC